MWKTHFIVDTKGIVFHSPCGKRCGKLFQPVDKKKFSTDFEFSTGVNFAEPVEMLKTFFNFMKTNAMFDHRGILPVENFSADNAVTICKHYQ